MFSDANESDDAICYATSYLRKSGKTQAMLDQIPLRLVDASISDDCIGYQVYGPGCDYYGTLVEFKHVCDNCREVMMRAWGMDCPICGLEMQRVMPWIRFGNG